jgi:hypothetical protein
MLRRAYIRRKLTSYTHLWPIYEPARKPPEGWAGWPERKKFALLLTHDVETDKGRERCKRLAATEEQFGLRSAFYFVPKRYDVSPRLRDYLTGKGFEVGVHGLQHDGRLYASQAEFQQRAVEINKYLSQWHSGGFSSPSMLHNLEWIHDLDVQYDISTYDTDPFEPQAGGVGTVFPFCVRDGSNCRCYVELPYTMPQDFTLFVLMKQTDINTWKKKLDWIAEYGGMVHLKTHPDYMNFGDTKLNAQEYPSHFYVQFLEYLQSAYKGRYWHVLPKDMAQFCSTNRLRQDNGVTLELSEILCPRCRTLVEQKRLSFISPAGNGEI